MKYAWWESFFSGLWLEVQRNIITKEQTEKQADFIEKVLGLSPRAKALDVPCGEGRLSLELARRGYHLTAVDATGPLLEDARRKAEEMGLDIRFEQRDMRDLPWKNGFDAAFCFWGSFGYFDDSENARFLQGLASCMKPGGRILIDIHVAETLLPMFKPRDWERVGEILIIHDRHYDHATSRIDEDWTIIKGRTRITRRSSIRIYTYQELCRMLMQAGFGDFESYSSLDQDPFKTASRRLYMVAATPAS